MAGRGVIYRLRRGLADLLAPEEEERPRPVAAARPAAAAADFEDRLKAMLLRSGQPALQSGRVNFIGLQKVRERFGAEWERVAERVERIARSVVERHLAPDDIYTGINSVTFVMVFARLTQDQAKVKCLAIADEIARAVLGERGGDLLEVKAAVKRIDGRLDLETVSLTDQLCASLDRAEELEFAARPPPAAGTAVSASPRAGPRPQHRDLLAHLRYVYRPFWDRARNVVSAYLGSAQMLSADGLVVLGDAETLLQGDLEERARLDEKIRERVLHDLAALTREGRQLPLVLPVHFETLAAVARRRDYLAALAQRTSDGAAKHLLIEIAAIPAGVPQSRLVEITSPLRSHCRGFLLSLPFDTGDPANIKGCGAAAVGCDIAGAPAPEAVLMHHMNRFAGAAEKAGVPSYLHGATSLSRAVAALGAGFSYIDGRAVAGPVDNPCGVVEFRLDDLYRAFIKD